MFIRRPSRVALQRFASSPKLLLLVIPFGFVFILSSTYHRSKLSPGDIFDISSNRSVYPAPRRRFPNHHRLWHSSVESLPPIVPASSKCQAFAKPPSLTLADPPDTADPQLSFTRPKHIYFLSYDDPFTDLGTFCAIESAATLNPHHLITVFTVSPSTFLTAFKRAFLIPKTRPPEWVSRVTVETTRYTEIFADTPFEDWYAAEDHLNSKWPSQNLGNALRLATLYKRGGIYLDLDFVSVRPLPVENRWLGVQGEDGTVNNAAMGFEKGDEMLWMFMEEFVKGWNGYEWGHQGPYLLTRVLQTQCNHKPTSESPSQTSTTNNPLCTTLTIFPQPKFYPLPWSSTDSFALDAESDEGCELLREWEGESVGVHLWGALIRERKWEKASVLGRLTLGRCSATRTLGGGVLGFVDT